MVYFNNAATSFPKPPIVIETVYSFLQHPSVTSSRSNRIRKEKNILEICRKNLKILLDAEEEKYFSFTSGATESLNLAILGLPYKNRHFITSVVEHNSVLRPLKHLEREGKISLTLVKCDKNGRINPKEIKQAIHNKTFAIILTHASNVTGTVQDLETISQIAQEKGVFLIVDASQSLGSIPFSLKKIKANVVAFTGHKSLFGLEGVGGIYIDNQIPIKPLKTGGTGFQSEKLLQPEERPIYYEAGTLNVPGIAAMNAGIEWILETGIEKIQKRKQELTKILFQELKKINSLCINAVDIEERLGILSFVSETLLPDDIGYILEESYDIIVRTGLHCAPLIHSYLGNKREGSVRISLSYFTKEEEVEYFIKAMREIFR